MLQSSLYIHMLMPTDDCIKETLWDDSNIGPDSTERTATDIQQICAWGKEEYEADKKSRLVKDQVRCKRELSSRVMYLAMPVPTMMNSLIWEWGDADLFSYSSWFRKQGLP